MPTNKGLRIRYLILFVLLMASVQLIFAQVIGPEVPNWSTKPDVRESGGIEMNVEMALVNVTVTDPYSRVVTSELAEMTGGRLFPVSSLNDLPDIARKIGMELRNQYVLGYRPTDKRHNGSWRKIKVKLHVPRGLSPLSVYAKTGYYAPTQSR